MEKATFIEKMKKAEESVLEVKWAYSCNAISEAFTGKTHADCAARKAYSKCYNLYSGQIVNKNLGVLWNMHEDNKQLTRIAMLRLFTEMCLSTKEYKKF